MRQTKNMWSFCLTPSCNTFQPNVEPKVFFQSRCVSKTHPNLAAETATFRKINMLWSNKTEDAIRNDKNHWLPTIQKKQASTCPKSLLSMKHRQCHSDFRCKFNGPESPPLGFCSGLPLKLYRPKMEQFVISHFGDQNIGTILSHTVDGWNPAPPGMVLKPYK